MADLLNPRGSFSPPRQLEEFLIERPVGRGASGHVYLARDTVLDRAVAIKFLGGRQLSEHARRRFLVEARAIARLKHPSVVTVYRFGEWSGRPYLVSEYVPGQSLARLPKPIPWCRALTNGAELARGLAAAHQEGVLHRDIKPANVMITDGGAVKLLDFGLAKLSGILEEGQSGIMALAALGVGRDSMTPSTVDIGSEPPPSMPELPEPTATLPNDGAGKGGRAVSVAEPLTRIGTVMGTPAYMAPEAWGGLPATPMTDVYSLGAVLYELCAGKAPHFSEDVSEIEVNAVTQDARPLAEVVPDIDRRFAAIVDRCLRRDPKERFPSGVEVRDALTSLLVPSTASLVRQELRRSWPLVVLGLVLIVGGSLGGMYWLAKRAVAQQESPLLKPRRVVAVLGLVNDSGRAGDAWYAEALGELLSREVALGERLRVVAAESVQAMMQESKLREARSFDVATLQQIRRRLDAAVVISGSYSMRGARPGTLQLSVLAQDTDSGQTLATGVVEGPATEVFRLVAQVAQRVRVQLGAGDVPTNQRTGLRVAHPDTLKLYGEALQELRRFHLREAGNLLARVIELDPDFPLAYEALAAVWRSLGYELRARGAEEGGRAHLGPAARGAPADRGALQRVAEGVGERVCDLPHADAPVPGSPGLRAGAGRGAARGGPARGGADDADAAAAVECARAGGSARGRRDRAGAGGQGRVPRGARSLRRGHRQGPRDRRDADGGALPGGAVVREEVPRAAAGRARQPRGSGRDLQPRRRAARRRGRAGRDGLGLPRPRRCAQGAGAVPRRGVAPHRDGQRHRHRHPPRQPRDPAPAQR